MPLLDAMTTLLRRDPIGRAARTKVRKLCQCLTVAAGSGLPRTYIFFGESPGDDMLATAVLREMHDRGMSRPWYGSNYPDLFAGNPHVERVVPMSSQFGHLLRKLGRVVYDLGYKVPNDNDRSTPVPPEHLVAMMARNAGLSGHIDVCPHLHLSETEIAAGRIVDNQIAIMSTGMNAKMPMANKQWPPERFQQVVDALRDRFNFVQLGVNGDVPLEGVTQLCGKKSIRESAAVLKNSLCFVGTVGFLMHLARAVDCRSVIIYGGRETPSQSGYIANENLYSAVPCSPCWLINRCDFDRKCLKMIEADAVIAALETQLSRHGTPLPIERASLAPLAVMNSLESGQLAR
jgi:hypothetical protein